MRVVVSGGSNSLRKGGYVAHLSALAGESVEIVNISLGAAPSLMGFFQQCRVGELKAGDILILEYALNDLNHIATKGYRASDLLRTVELILRHYAATGVRVQPVVMMPLPFEEEIVIPRFHVELHRLFQHYGLPYLDVSTLAREALGVPHLGKGHYEDPNHYTPNGAVVRLVAEKLLSCLPDCRSPRQAAPVHCGEDQALKVRLDLQGGTRLTFASGAAEAHYYRPDAGPVMAATDKDAILAGMVVLASPEGGVLRVECEDRDCRLSLRHDHPDFDKLAIKMIGLDNLVTPPCS